LLDRLAANFVSFYLNFDIKFKRKNENSLLTSKRFIFNKIYDIVS